MNYHMAWCPECKALIPTQTAFQVKKRYQGGREKMYYFCSEDEANDFYLAKLNFQGAIQ